jgi:beta-mannosidase
MRQCEWVEHRHWIYRTHLPDSWWDGASAFRLECLGLDYSGWIYVNGKEAASFMGTHVPHTFDITAFLKATGNTLEIVFDLPPRWLGQFGYSSKMIEWKPRFNYTWDWVPRLLQIGIWDDITLAAVDGSEIGSLYCLTDADPGSGTGSLELRAAINARSGAVVQVSLEGAGGLVRQEQYKPAEFASGIRWENLPVELWWPNLEGKQPLYQLTCTLLDGGLEQDRIERRVGFKHIEWAQCAGAPEGADPWLCVVNGRPVFLQGVNFAPLSGNFADLTRADYARRLQQYQELGTNTFRINACQFLERKWFYDICDELGLMVWQEFPLTSSGLENWPPEDEASIAAMAEIGRSFIQRRRHHACVLLWSGGNELQGELDGRKTGMGKPCDLSHPMLKRLQEVAQAEDPIHRFIPTSPSGPRAGADPADFGKGLHWDVHGGAALLSLEEAQRYWAGDDALFRSELYCSGASPVEVILKYAGDLQVFPATADNPYWTHPTAWWIDWHKLKASHGREPKDLEEYVQWSQAHQAQMLSMEMKACKERFPRCGGVLLWSGHDTFPMPINSSLIDYDSHLKPVALAVARVWHTPAGQYPSKGD